MSDLMVTTVSRKAVRDAISTGLDAALAGLVKELAGYQKANFEELTPFVRVYGEGSDRGSQGGNSIGALMTSYFYTVQVWIPYTWTVASWNESDAEDALDEIEQAVAEWVAGNPEGPWHELEYGDRSQIAVLKSNSGKTYLVEDIPLKAWVFV